MDKVMIFIDGANLFFGMINRIGNIRLDYQKFTQKLCGTDRKLIRTYYYDAPKKQADAREKYQSQQRFFDVLRKLQYFDIRFGRLEREHQKGVDVLLAVDMIKFAANNAYDTAILVSGDSDLASAVDLVKTMGKHVEVVYFDQCYHLKGLADKMIILDASFLSDCWV